MRSLKPREDRISKGSEGGSEMLKEAPGQCLKTSWFGKSQVTGELKNTFSGNDRGKNGCGDTGE